MNAIELVVMDMAGTTVLDKGNVAESFLTSFSKFGYAFSKESAQKVMGFRKKDAIRMLLEEFYPDQAKNEHLIESIHEAFNVSMVEFYRSGKDLKPLPYAEELFVWLKNKGIKTALNTGFTKRITDTILQRLEWEAGKTVDYVISSDEVQHGRPWPDMIFAIMKKLDLTDSKKVVKVGDTEVDIEEGRQAGCRAIIAVTTGASSREKLERLHPDQVIDNLKELPSVIESLS